VFIIVNGVHSIINRAAERVKNSKSTSTHIDLYIYTLLWFELEIIRNKERLIMFLFEVEVMEEGEGRKSNEPCRVLIHVRKRAI
jgi:hypothetical protein